MSKKLIITDSFWKVLVPIIALVMMMLPDLFLRTI